MKISSIKLNDSNCGLRPFDRIPLGDMVILTGENGSGKTRILKTIERHIYDLQAQKENNEIELTIERNENNEIRLSKENASIIGVVNYSHYDANLQSPKHFTPYVIQNAKNILKECNYEETALNSLLFIYDMAVGYSDEYKDGKEFEKFRKDIALKIGVDFSCDETVEGKTLNLFNKPIDSIVLSPGQQYLIRMAVACYQNKNNKNIVFCLDEPELHLHPKALIDIIDYLIDSFQGNQFWISTHSLALISHLTSKRSNVTVLNMIDGKPTILRSDSSRLIEGLIGGIDNTLPMQLFLSTPEDYAANKFSIECSSPPDTLSATKKDPQTEITNMILKPDDVVVDYGAGKGRFFEGLGIDFADSGISKKIKYYAFDPSSKDSDKCKWVMNQYGSSDKNYYNEIDRLIKVVDSSADYVLLINVLHEIDPLEWKNLFVNIDKLLKDTGKLIIVERSELTVGEAPYRNRFLVITHNSANSLFGEENVEWFPHPKKEHIQRYIVSKEGLNINDEKIKSFFEQVKIDAYSKIKEIKEIKEIKVQDYKNGLKMAFWLHQFANAILNNEDFDFN